MGITFGAGVNIGVGNVSPLKLTAGTIANATLQSQSINSPGTWTVPFGIYSITVTVIGGGGGGGTYVPGTFESPQIYPGSRASGNGGPGGGYNESTENGLPGSNGGEGSVLIRWYQ